MERLRLRELPQYHFDRAVFMDAFYIVFSYEEIFELECACQEHRCLGDFLLYYVEDEFYIIHFDSGTIINWYKHLGRTNTCNKENFDFLDLIQFLKLLKNSIGDVKKGELKNGD